MDAPEDEDAAMSELIIFPAQAAAGMSISTYGELHTDCPCIAPPVEPIFEALSSCAALHPDPKGNGDELGEDSAFADDNEFDVFTGGPDEELSALGRVRSDHVNNSRYQPY